MNPALSIALFYKDGSSDKEYRVEMREEGTDQWSVYGFNGRRGSALKEQKKTTSPVDYSAALKIYEKLVQEKTKKGYTRDASGVRYQTTTLEERVSGWAPQLLNPVRDDSNVVQLIRGADQVAQEKHDGERRLVEVVQGESRGINRSGLYVGLPTTIADHFMGLNDPTLVVDGEIMGERYVIFDVLRFQGEDLRSKTYQERLTVLNNIPEGNGVERIVSAFTTKEKQALLDKVRARRGEGIVFKDLNAAYIPGRPASGGSQHKYKFVEVATVRVSALNQKRSVAVEGLDDAGRAVALGNVTLPEAAVGHVKVNDLINVEYLYWYPGGSLYQPVFRGVRADVTEPDRLDQLKPKGNGSALDDEAIAEENPASTAKKKKKAAP